MNNIIIVSKENIRMNVYELQKAFKQNGFFKTNKIFNLPNVFVFEVTFCDTEKAYEFVMDLKYSKEFLDITFDTTNETVQVIGVEEHHDFMDEKLELLCPYEEWVDNYENESLFDDLTRNFISMCIAFRNQNRKKIMY